jgi:hypothetical protein
MFERQAVSRNTAPSRVRTITSSRRSGRPFEHLPSRNASDMRARSRLSVATRSADTRSESCESASITSSIDGVGKV